MLVDMKSLIIDDKKEIILKIIFCMSLPFFTMICSTRASRLEFIIEVFLSFFIAIFISFKLYKDMYKKIDNKLLLISLILSCYFERILMQYCYPIDMFTQQYINKLLRLNFAHETIILFLVVASIPSLISLFYIFLKWIIPKMKEVYKKISPTEKMIICMLLILGFLSSFIIYNRTSCFYSPHSYDVIYTTDSEGIFNQNAYMNLNMPENDIRQPLFGLFAMPFSIIAYIFSDIFFFIPNGYAVFLNTIQITLLGISILMVARMLNIEQKGKLIYILYSFCTFPLIIFSFVMEQYIFATFYLILAIYIGYYEIFKINYLYIGAVGTLITSGIIFPLISKFKSIKNWFSNIIKCFFAFMGTVIVFGQMSTLIHAVEKIKALSRFAGEEVIFMDRLKQFLYFVRTIFLAPNSKIVYGLSPSYRLNEISFISITGIVILILCLISVIMNRKNKFAIISFLWILFSFIILCLIGWGTVENGLILYSLYFSWAYLALIYLLIDKIIKNSKIKFGILSIICIILVIINVPEFINILKFGLAYYPA